MTSLMKSFVTLVLSVGLLATPALAQQTKTNAPAKIKATEAKQYIGSTTVVAGKVAEVNMNKAKTLMRLNLEKPFPDQVFTAVIFGEKTNLFQNLQELEGKDVEIKGTITEYRSQPQIILTNADQLKIVGEAAPTGKADKK
jgi:DNA/RNA endonuclease YhcR with UshA esterase domain